MRTHGRRKNKVRKQEEKLGEVDLKIRKRKKLIDQITSMSDVRKKIEGADFGVRPWELREERWNKLRQKGTTLFPKMCEF